MPYSRNLFSFLLNDLQLNNFTDVRWLYTQALWEYKRNKRYTHFTYMLILYHMVLSVYNTFTLGPFEHLQQRRFHFNQ